MPQKKTNTTQTFSVSVRVDSRKLKKSQQYSVQVRVTGGRWIGKVLRTVGGLLRSRMFAAGTTLVAAAALARLAS
jgi:hypothetical protein